MNQNSSAKLVTIEYDDDIVRKFCLATMFWGFIAMFVGVFAAFELSFWQMNGKFLETITFGLIQSEGLPFLTFGRLRPLHTNAAIFAFVGNMMFAGIYYSTQRLCKARMASDFLSKLHFWGWQFIILCAPVTLLAGMTRGKEYAELIWPINVMVVIIWVVFAWNFFWTLKRRNEPSLYVALWFYIATIVTVAMLYIVNHLSLPTSLTHSYPIFGGVQDALVQWWYGHNAVAFFLTTPILGIMYYFMPKAAERPVYSYRLSIVHFWSLVFIYIWAGPHHLLYTSLPTWLQYLGMLFSIMLWAPSWGGMLNGLLTLRGAWDKLRTDPVIKFLVASITFYGMATFEGPLLAIRSVNALSHYTDWTIGHVHAGTLGWNGFMAAGMLYWMMPRLYGRKLYSISLANMHFWIGMVGILLYVSAMWASGISQGLMLNQLTEDGTQVKYQFVETLEKIAPLMLARSIGGALYLFGFGLMIYNLFRTIRGATPVTDRREVALLTRQEKDTMSWARTFFNDPVFYCFAGMLLCILWTFLPNYSNLVALILGLLLIGFGILRYRSSGKAWGKWYDSLLENYLPFTVLTFISVVIGGLVQIVPTVLVNNPKNVEERIQIPYTPLELMGRDIYVSEGCYNCHSQMIRTLLPDVVRYGYADDEGYSRLGESIYDHPYQWGSKRTGPDLAREGGKQDNIWHYIHMRNPRHMHPNSIMPNYPWLFTNKVDFDSIPGRIAAMRRLGVPYEPMTKDVIKDKAITQAMEIANTIKTQHDDVMADTEIIALIAYLQKLGKYEVVPPKEKKKPGLFTPIIPDELREEKVLEAPEASGSTASIRQP
ncbi:MAG: cytochrome-c oxidase, cbb3-type subunit I [Chthoniobacterales bacterium]